MLGTEALRPILAMFIGFLWCFCVRKEFKVGCSGHLIDISCFGMQNRGLNMFEPRNGELRSWTQVFGMPCGLSQCLWLKSPTMTKNPEGESDLPSLESKLPLGRG